MSSPTADQLIKPTDQVAYEAWEDNFFDLSGRKINLVNIYLSDKPDMPIPMEPKDLKDKDERNAAVAAWILHQQLTAWRFLIARVKHLS